MHRHIVNIFTHGKVFVVFEALFGCHGGKLFPPYPADSVCMADILRQRKPFDQTENKLVHLFGAHAAAEGKNIRFIRRKPQACACFLAGKVIHNDRVAGEHKLRRNGFIKKPAAALEGDTDTVGYFGKHLCCYARISVLLVDKCRYTEL